MKSIVAFVALALLAGCGYMRPYKIEVNQGNFIVQEQIDKLKTGMSRTQVRALLGPPLIESAFHSDRWDYQFSLERRGQQLAEHRASVFFEGDGLKSWDAKALPKAPVIERDPALNTPVVRTENDSAWQRLKDWWKK